MADSNNRPVGDVIAIVERANDRRSSDFVPMGAAWLNEKGNLTFTLHAEPLAWRDPAVRRFVMVRFRDGVRLEAPAGNNSPRAGARNDDGEPVQPLTDDDIAF